MRKKVKKILNTKLKYFSFIFALLLLVLSLQRVYAAADASLYFNSSSLAVANGASFTVDVMVNPGSTGQVNNVDLYLAYDQTKLSLDSISSTNFPIVVSSTIPSPQDGTASFSAGTSYGSNVTSISTYATLHFHALAEIKNSPLTILTGTNKSAVYSDTQAGINLLGSVSPGSVTVDSTAPSGGSITYVNSYVTSATVSLTVSDGSDSGSGLDATSRIVQRKSATLSNGICGAYGTYAAITPTGSYPSLTDATVTTGNCYQYQYLISDNAGNQANYSSTNTAKIDTVAPAVAQVTAITSTIKSTVSNYTFSVSEPGTITYGGSCASSTTAAASGNNTITFNALTIGNHTDCTIKISDLAGNQSTLLSISPFAVTYPADLNNDHAVNGADFSLLHANYGSVSVGNIADINSDNVVNGADFSLLHADYNKYF